ILEAEGKSAQKSLAGVLTDQANVIRKVLEGDAALEIVEYARVEKAGLIVMPTHGYGPFRRFIVGSVTTKVLHDAQCPVLTGVHVERREDQQAFGVGRILCAIGLGPDDARVLRWAEEFAKAAGSYLVAGHVAKDEPQARLDRLRLIAPDVET